MSKTLIILNPHAGSGRAGKVWEKLEPLLWQELGELVIAVTQHPEEVAKHLQYAYDAGLTRVISIGGDGTNHSLINALMQLNQEQSDKPQMVYGMLPIGTGKDWARSQGIPFDVAEAAKWIAQAEPRPIDIGEIQMDEATDHFLNIASAGISGDVVRRVSVVSKRRPWTFLLATLQSLLNYQPQVMRIRLDDQDWYEGETYALAVANGTTFGHGMQIAPDAKPDDGWFDVVLMKGMRRLDAMLALRTVYDGSHVNHPKVEIQRAKQVEVTSFGEQLGMERDGEFSSGRQLQFTLQPQRLHLLLKGTRSILINE